ncbi:MAG TPA: hypothetical protein VK821_20215 [Dehalococcoidia bacterium]|nr:hypothetical protein [Dehalococcoidia bacterium]
MVAITERAAALLEQIQTQRALPRAPRIDIAPGDDNFARVMTDPAADDEVLYHGERPVLFISAPAAEMLEDCMLTTQETPEGLALTVAQRGE